MLIAILSTGQEIPWAKKVKPAVFSVTALRLVKNVTDTKLVRNLAKCQRFSIGSLRIGMIWLCYFFYMSQSL